MNNYEININTLALIPKGSDNSIVYEEEEEFYINKPVIKILDDSCKFFGSSYNGRFEGTKNLINISHKAPIIIEETKNIIFFPTTSPRLDSCMWISLNNLKEYFKCGKQTVLHFYCGKQMKINISYGIFDNQVLRATRLMVILNNRIKNTKKMDI